ncbi:uncharacterized protein PG998_004208 [Apiospora kogelbergensis]|uniref:uncharacterized protein n=1 Tax=Apiospora kogelbergensis TaxID=1337665 RepID=UPI0031322C12
MDPSSGLPRRPPPPSLQERAFDRAERFVAKGKVPRIRNWDWMPFLTAIFERDTTIPINEERHDPTLVEPEDEDAEFDPDSTDVGNMPVGYENRPSPIPSTLEPDQRGQSHQPPINYKLPPPKRDGDGAWDHVVYVPEWSDPDWDPNWEPAAACAAPRGRAAEPDRLRPAVGIPSDRTDGRSRTSPTFSQTRDYQAGIDDKIITQLMDEPTRARSLQVTQGLIAQGQTQYRGSGIAPEVVDEFRKSTGIPSQEEIRTGAVTAGIPFERYIETLPQNVRNIYSGLIDDVLEDEDYQRILFYDMTSDEMFRNNIFTMSNDEKYNLTEMELHPLVSKNMWENTLYRGQEKGWPRMVYDFWGKREEYDVHRNPLIWAALQPALQLVTRVLHTKPAFWQSIKDLRTRRKIDPNLDPRDEEDQRTPFLQKIIRQDEIPEPGDANYAADVDMRYSILEDLANQGFDFVKHVDRLMQSKIELALGPAFLDDGKSTTFVYGRTSLNIDQNDKPASYINVSIAAELVWPLLIPIYSSSEKLCASYVIATTILHELMHATAYTTDLLCMNEPSFYHEEQTPEISSWLNRWWQSATDTEVAHGEPWWRDDLRSELGWAFEKEFWGDSTVVITNGSAGLGVSKQLQCLPLAIMAEQHTPSGKNHGYDYLLGNYPLEDYYRPVPIDYYAKFFQDSFWQVDYPRHGFEAFRRLPPERQNLCLMVPTWYPEKAMQTYFGADNWRFFRVIIRMLRRFGLPLIAEYLNQLIWEVRGFEILRSRWVSDVDDWEYVDKNFVAQHAQLEDLAQRIDNSWRGFSQSDQALYREWQSDKLPPYPSVGEWATIMQRQFVTLTNENGVYFSEIEKFHQIIQDELRVMERMVFEFLTVRKGERKIVFKPDADADPLLSLVNRMVGWKEDIEEVHARLNDLHKAAQLFDDTNRITTWCAWLEQDAKRLETLCNLVMNDLDDDREAKTQREQLRTVPTALYERRANRLRNLAMREYTVLDQRIRIAVDEMYSRLEIWLSLSLEPPRLLDQQEMTWTAREKINSLQKRLQGADRNVLGTPLTSVNPSTPSSVFNFSNTGSVQSVAGGDTPRRVGSESVTSTAGPSTMGQPPRRVNNGMVFGQAGFQGTAPRRTVGPRSSTSAAAFARFSNAGNALGNAPPRFQGNFASQVNVAPGPPSSFGPPPMTAAQNPFASTGGTMMGTAPFPFPYADRKMTTEDLAYVTQRPTPAMQQFMQALQVQPGNFREPPKDDDDHMEM